MINLTKCRLCLKRIREHELTRRAMVVKGIVTVAVLTYVIHPDPAVAAMVATGGNLIWIWLDG